MQKMLDASHVKSVKKQRGNKMLVTFVRPDGKEFEVETDNVPPKNAMVVINSDIKGRVEDVSYYYADNKETKVTVFLWVTK